MHRYRKDDCQNRVRGSILYRITNLVLITDIDRGSDVADGIYSNRIGSRCDKDCRVVNGLLFNACTYRYSTLSCRVVDTNGPSCVAEQHIQGIRNRHVVDLQIDDVTIADTLDALFLYGPADNIRVNNATVECTLAACDAAEELVIYNAARVVGAGTDAVGGDSVSYVATTVDVGDENQGGNTQQNAAANSVLAVVFTVTVQ